MLLDSACAQSKASRQQRWLKFFGRFYISNILEIGMTIMSDRSMLPVAIIGAGPIGLAAAAHLIERKVPVKIYESDETIGALSATGAMCGSSPPGADVDPAAAACCGGMVGIAAGKCLADRRRLYAQDLQPLAATSELQR